MDFFIGLMINDNKKQCYNKITDPFIYTLYYQLTSLFCGLPNKPRYLMDILVWLCWGSGYPPRQWPGCWWSWWSTTVSIHSSPMILTGKQQRSGSEPQYFVWSRSGFEPQHFVWSRSNFSLRKWKKPYNYLIFSLKRVLKPSGFKFLLE